MVLPVTLATGNIHTELEISNNLSFWSYSEPEWDAQTYSSNL